MALQGLQAQRLKKFRKQDDGIYTLLYTVLIFVVYCYYFT